MKKDIFAQVEDKLEKMSEDNPLFNFAINTAPAIVTNFTSRCFEKLIEIDNYQSLPQDCPIDWDNAYIEYRKNGLEILSEFSENEMLVTFQFKKKFIGSFHATLVGDEIKITEKII
jgi:hypothetical protein